MTREALSEGVNHEILGADHRRLADAMFRMFRSPSRFDFPFVRKRYPVLDPRYFDDPVAMRTGWAPMSPGGFRRTLHRLREIGPQVLSFQPTAYRHYQTFVYLGSLLAFGNVLIASLLRNELNINRHEHWWVIQLLAQILVGCCVTLFLLNRSIVIDGNTAEVRLGLPGWGGSIGCHGCKAWSAVPCLLLRFTAFSCWMRKFENTVSKCFGATNSIWCYVTANASTLLTMEIKGRSVGMLVICRG